MSNNDPRLVPIPGILVSAGTPDSIRRPDSDRKGYCEQLLVQMPIGGRLRTAALLFSTAERAQAFQNNWSGPSYVLRLDFSQIREVLTANIKSPPDCVLVDVGPGDELQTVDLIELSEIRAAAWDGMESPLVPAVKVSI